MTPKQKVEALLKKTVAAGCPVGEVIAANELAVTLAIKYRIPSGDLAWPALPAGHRWEGQRIVPVAPPNVNVTPPGRVRGLGQRTTRALPSTSRAPHPPPKPAPAARQGSKAAAILAKLNSWPGTAISVNEMMFMTGWQPHTVRGWVSLQNKSRKASGLPPIQSTRNKAGELVYYI